MRISALRLFALLCGAAGCLKAQTTFTFTDLGTLGGTNSYAYAINASGQIVGESSTAGGASHATLWSGGARTDLGTLGGTNSLADGINALGQIVGGADLPGATTDGVGSRAVFWNTGSITALNLGTLGGNNSEARTINTSGLIGGSARNFTQGSQPVTWNSGVAPTSPTTTLGVLGGTNSHEVIALNDSGVAVGQSRQTGDTNVHAVVWNTGSSTISYDLGTLGGSNSYALSINASGVIVGVADIAGNGASHAIRWIYNGDGGYNQTDLGTLGGTSSFATGINAAGQIIGGSDTLSSGQHAFLYSGGTLYDLNSFVTGATGWTLVEADGINDLGQIVGFATDLSGHDHAFLLTPTAIPEPTTCAAIAALGALGLVIWRRCGCGLRCSEM